jgi:hypothetical protein
MPIDNISISTTHDTKRIENLCQERFPNAVLAREGMEISIGEAT